MDVDATGRVFVVGSYFGKLVVGDATLLEDKPALNDHGFVLALDASGKALFARAFSAVAVTGVASDRKGGAWIAAAAGGPARRFLWIGRVDDTGRTTAELGSSPEIFSDANGIAVNSKGHVVVAGTYDILLSINGERIFDPPHDAFVFELDENAKVVWKRKLGVSGDVQHLAVDALDRIWIAATTGTPMVWGDAKINPKDGSGLLLAMGPDGSPRFARQFTAWPMMPRYDLGVRRYWKYLPGFYGMWENGASFALDPGGAPLLAVTFQGRFDMGEHHFTSKSARDVALSKIDPRDGRVVWARQVGGDAGQLAHAIATDSSGRAYVGGAYVDKPHAWLTNIEP
jgi:hypothetical protein